jgi:hypothetical protein
VVGGGGAGGPPPPTEGFVCPQTVTGSESVAV